MYLNRYKKILNCHEKFLRVATEPLHFIQFKDFYKDLDELMASKSFKSNDPVSIDDFCEFFQEKQPWSSFK